MEAIGGHGGRRLSRHAAVLGCGALLVASIFTPTSMASTAGAVGAADPGHRPAKTLVVDDDGQDGDQDKKNGDLCGNARFTSIQAAVTKARSGDVVRVCPGVYTEFVLINKPLTLLGQVDAVASVDCFDTTPSQARDLDPTRYVILERPQNQAGNLVTVAAGGVSVAGLVLQGATTPAGAPNPVDAALDLKSDSAGARVHDNLFRLNSLGIDLGSDGSAATRVDHNCLRGDLPSDSPSRATWGMASQRQDFVRGLVDHNETFRHTDFAYGVGDLASTRDAVFADNVSRQDGTGFFVTGSSNISITGNSIVDGATAGVRFQASLGTSQNALVAGNVISGFGGGAHTVGLGIAVAGDVTGTIPSVNGVEVADNVLTDNAVGVSVILINPQIQVHDNTANHNRQYGIRARNGAATAPVFTATFTDNTMLGNGQPPFGGIPNISDADAFDANFSNNEWVGTVCEHDIPVGKICGVSGGG